MISIMELMEKKTPSIKKYDKKKGMTLVEVMAAMAIFSILFVGISGFIINVAKSEGRSERKLESDGYLKNALLMFESGVVKPSNLLNSNSTGKITIKFNDINEMQDRIEKLEETTEVSTYIIEITARIEDGNLYTLDATFINERGERYSKYIYVFEQ